MYFVYILECKDRTLYTGITTDLKRRLEEHKAGTGAAYTRAHGAIKLVYSERKLNRSTASKREAVIKKLTRAQKLKLIY
jgi:putative endonuclease